ncbi:MAG: hypothetical protein ABI855_17380, partial [Bacteroidota bacterium]
MNTFKNLTMVIFIALLLYSCQKEKQIVKGKVPETNNCLNAERIDPADMETAMNSFITLVNENNVIDCPDYEAQDALLIIEAALNYKTGTPAEDYYEVALDTTTFEMDLMRDGETGEFIFSNENMSDLWPTVLDAAMEAHNRVSFDSINDPFNIVVDLEFAEFDRESEASTQTAVIRVVTWVGNTPLIGYNCNYNEDWWADGSQQTTNGCNGNTSILSWAAREIQKRLSPG